VRIERAGLQDIRGLARVKWIDRSGDRPDTEAFESFVDEFAAWWESHQSTHSAFVARTDDGTIVGAAWAALLPGFRAPGTPLACRRISRASS